MRNLAKNLGIYNQTDLANWLEKREKDFEDSCKIYGAEIENTLGNCEFDRCLSFLNRFCEQYPDLAWLNWRPDVKVEVEFKDSYDLENYEAHINSKIVSKAVENLTLYLEKTEVFEISVMTGLKFDSEGEGVLRRIWNSSEFFSYEENIQMFAIALKEELAKH